MTGHTVNFGLSTDLADPMCIRTWTPVLLAFVLHTQTAKLALVPALTWAAVEKGWTRTHSCGRGGGFGDGEGEPEGLVLGLELGVPLDVVLDDDGEGLGLLLWDELGLFDGLELLLVPELGLEEGVLLVLVGLADDDFELTLLEALVLLGLADEDFELMLLEAFFVVGVAEAVLVLDVADALVVLARRAEELELPALAVALLVLDRAAVRAEPGSRATAAARTLGTVEHCPPMTGGPDIGAASAALNMLEVRKANPATAPTMAVLRSCVLTPRTSPRYLVGQTEVWSA